MITVTISDARLREAAAGGMDAFLAAVAGAVREAAGGSLTAEVMAALTPEQVTLWGYMALREEVMDGGFVQLIVNGWGPFIFLNPFARALREWGLRDLSKLVYAGRKLYEENREALERDMTDEEFMALFEQYPAFDDLDDAFIEGEEEWTAEVARYVDAHLAAFVAVV